MRNLAVFLVLAPLVTAFGCESSPGSPADCSAAEELTNESIAGGRVLTAGRCYIVRRDLTLDDGTLEASAGVTVQFATDVGLSIRSGGLLKVSGTSAEPVLFTGIDTLVEWRGVRLADSQGVDNDWSQLVVENAGSERWTGADYSAAAVYLEGSTTVSIDGVEIRGSSTHGILVTENVTLNFINGSLRENAYPAYLHPEVVSAIPAETTIEGNEHPHLRVVFGNNDTVNGEHTWAAHLYRIENRFFVEGDLTIAAGARLEFAQDASLILRPDASFTAIGSGSSPITFAGAAETRGYWKGIEVQSGGTGEPVTVGATFEHCVIADAGGQQWSGHAESQSALYLQDTSAASISNTLFTNNAGYGLWASRNARLVGFANNTWRGNALVMFLHPDRVGELSGTSEIGENDDDTIHVVFGNNDTVSTAATWRDLGVAYRIRDRFFVEAALVIDAGTTLAFAQDRGVIIRETVGSLTVDGTEADPVSLIGQNAVATGFWQGLRFESNSAANQLTYANILHSGSLPWTGDLESAAAIYVEANAQVSLSDVSIGSGGGYGVFLEAESSALICSGEVSFEDLGKGGVWHDDDDASMPGCG